ncbi:S-layer homology domain-containing protein [Cohnella nanjingensis]|uniref:S-layer homology domain-containing protein n=1 Tax=Cohnella nanjingensis TaxID=1387779 RepID=A0A7X0RP15_9BACL|nr:S-layer homology domain-containing protein [Cohnella nanjingensis]MBB6669886.1 S-layer homology domain-containing protein [Cohnella nanjingensis]
MRTWWRKSLVVTLAFLIVIANGAWRPGTAQAGPADKPDKYITFVYDNFADSNPMVNKQFLALNGDARYADDGGKNVLRMTRNVGNVFGTAFPKNRRISLTNDRSFSTYFSFRMHGGSSSPADGIVFTVQTKSSSAGAVGQGMGYGGLQPSIGIEYDTYYNPDNNDPRRIGETTGTRSNHIAVDLNGVTKHAPSDFVNIDQGQMDLTNGIYYTWIDYDGLTDTLKVYLSKTNQLPDAPILTKTGLDLSKLLNQDEAYVGFTAATGGQNQNHDIDAWYFNNDSGPIEPAKFDYFNAPLDIKLGIVPGEGSKRSVQATVYDLNGDIVPNYPVTFSLYDVLGYLKNDGSHTSNPADPGIVYDDSDPSRVIPLEARQVETRAALDGETKVLDGGALVNRYVTVRANEYGVATTDLYSSVRDGFTTHVKSVVGGVYGGISYGGGAYAEGPVSFSADNEGPQLETAVVDNGDRGRLLVTFDEPVLYGGDGGFSVIVNDDAGNPIPAVIAGGSGTPRDPLVLDLPPGVTIPPGSKVQVTYRSQDGDVTDLVGNDLSDITSQPADNPFGPSGAAVINDAGRSQVALDFGYPVALNDLNPGLFGIQYVDGTTSKPVSVTGVTYDGSDTSRLILTLGGPVPAGAPVALNYQPTAGFPGITDLNGNTLSPLGNYPVRNQFGPVHAAVVNDESRQTVRVEFPSPVALTGDVKDAFLIRIAGASAPVSASDVQVDGSNPNALLLTLRLDEQAFPDGVPFGAAVTLDYAPASAIVQESGGQGRELALQNGFPVDNQLKPQRAAVLDDEQRDRVKVTFDSPIRVDPGSEDAFMLHLSGDSSPIPVTRAEADPQDPNAMILTLELDSGKYPEGVPAGIAVSMDYDPSKGRVEGANGFPLSPLSNFPVRNADAAGIVLTANPAAIVGDGKSRTELKAVITKPDGSPAAGVTVNFGAPAGKGSFPNGATAVTDASGIATIPYQSSAITGVDPQRILVVAKVNDAEQGLIAQAQIDIEFAPASVEGVVTSDNEPVSGAVVTITGPDGFTSTVTTGPDGAYAFVVPKGNTTYDIAVTRPFGASSSPVTYKQKVNVGDVAGTGHEIVPSTRTVTGIVGSKGPDGQSLLFDPAIVGQLKVYLKDADTGVYLTDAATGNGWFPLAGAGVFSIDNAVPNQAYQLEVRYVLPDPARPDDRRYDREIVINALDNNGTLPVIKLTQDGELNILEALIDPYGDITDAKTNAPVDGAVVKLYYADTPRNAANGVTPNTPVALPGIPGFAPNDNANPQAGKDGGKYAYLVYPTTDYYVVVTAAGYETYTSPILAVEHAIVRHDVKLQPVSGGSNPPVVTPTPTPTPPVQPAVGKPGLTVNLTVDRSAYEENGTATIVVDHLNDGTAVLPSGEITVTLPEGAKVLDADGGKVTGNKIVWTVSGLAAGNGGQHKIKVQWPAISAAEQVVEIAGQGAANGTELAHPDAARASAKVLLYSNRFGETVHIRYILGYPDGKFLPDRHLTRAELAAIIARLLNGGGTTEHAAYADVPAKHWASGYIRIVTDHEIFNGFNDGTFRPDVPVTREELATVMVRYLKLNVSQPIHSNFADTQGRWSSAAVEALFRNGLTTGYPDGTFKPGSGIVRTEAVTLINRLLFRGPLANVAPSFPDVKADHWAFGQVEEATHSHASTRASNGSEVFVKQVEDQVK